MEEISSRQILQNFFRLAILALALHLAAAGAWAQAAAPAGSARRGKQVFADQHCSQCHGSLGQGLTEAGPRIVPPPRTLTDFVEVVRKPQGDMAPVSAARVSDAELADIYAFLLSNRNAKWAK